jgi:uncharacterized protein YndB with AHSA1/START domain
MSAEVRSVIDPDERTATIRTSFEQPIEVVWTLWSDPDKLAAWWGPPGVLMTVDHHDLTPGGRVEVTVHFGDSVIRGRWLITSVGAPRSLTFTFESDGIGPTRIEVLLEVSPDAGTTMSVTARFATDADLRHAAEIGFADGIARSVAFAHAALTRPMSGGAA